MPIRNAATLPGILEVQDKCKSSISTEIQFSFFYGKKMQSKSSGTQKPWRKRIKRVKALLKNKRISKARSLIAKAAKEFPNQARVLVVANKVYRQSGLREEALLYAELLRKTHPRSWKGYYLSAKDRVALKEFSKARTNIINGLEKQPRQKRLLLLAEAIRRKHKEELKSTVENLTQKARYVDARIKIDEFLGDYPSEKGVLIMAQELFSHLGDHKTSLIYAELLIKHEPDNWDGYYRAAQVCRELKNHSEATARIREGLLKNPNDIHLLTLAHDHEYEHNNHEKALKYAKYLIDKHPLSWKGYVRSAKDFVVLNRIPEAQEAIREGLKRIPNHEGLLRVATKTFRASGDHDKSLEYAKKLVISHPGNWEGYCLAMEDQIVLQDFDGASKTIEDGIRLVSNKVDQKFLRELEGWATSSKNVYKDCKNLFDSWRDAKLFRITTLPNAEPRQPAPKANLKTIQYWSQAEIPSDVREVTETWNEILVSCGVEKIKVWHKEEAHSWIKTNAPEFLKAFESAPHYAAESDVFRLAYTKITNCLYIDSDLYPKTFTSSILSAALRFEASIFFCWSKTPFIQNSFFASRRDCKVFGRLRDYLNGWDYSGKKLSHSLIHDTFGPGSYNKIIQECMHRSRSIKRTIIIRGALDIIELDYEIFLLCHEDAFAHMTRPGGLEYKKTNMSWQVFCENTITSNPSS